MSLDILTNVDFIVSSLCRHIDNATCEIRQRLINFEDVPLISPEKGQSISFKSDLFFCYTNYLDTIFAVYLLLACFSRERNM